MKLKFKIQEKKRVEKSKLQRASATIRLRLLVSKQSTKHERLGHDEERANWLHNLIIPKCLIVLLKRRAKSEKNSYFYTDKKCRARSRRRRISRRRRRRCL
jgi:hypothetical protein